MNIFELRELLNAVEDKRKKALADRVEELQKKAPLNAEFDGHICPLPNGVRTFADMHWRCSGCKQYWHIKLVDNKHTWTMFGRLPAPQETTP
jgi:hypothetical protein